MNLNLSDNDKPTTQAMGRGRGRGVVAKGNAILPAGLWTELNNSAISTVDEPDCMNNREDGSRQFADADYSGLAVVNIPSGFGVRKGAGRGRSGNTPGIEIDKKGCDWNCPSCGNLNWSWRTNCNRCDAQNPNPVSVAVSGPNIVRDGAGGGFNERQDRASSSQVEIDEEGYDDFGRRINTNKMDKKLKEEAALARLKSTYGFLLDPTALSKASTIAPLPIASNTSNSARNTRKADDNDGSRGKDVDRDRGRTSAKDLKGRLRSRSRGNKRHRRSRSRSHSYDRTKGRKRSSSADRDRRKRRSRSRSRSRDLSSDRERGGRGRR